MKTSSWNLSRRRFLQSVALAAPSTIVSSSSAAAPSDRVTVGVIGLGSRAFNLIDDLLAESDAQIVAICDVDELHYRDREWGKGPAFGRIPGKTKIETAYAQRNKSGMTAGLDVYSDYRRICERDDIDAVVVATPDHWHALCTLESLANGKDVYCEKPVTHLFREGQRVYREVAKRNAIFQTGSQQRSDPLFRQAVELIRNGVIGKLNQIEVGLPPGYDKPQGDPMVTRPPEHLDYQMWCGPSPMLPYMRARHHRWWRGHRAFGGGVLMDWIGHHNDIAHWSLDLDHGGPVSVEAYGWTKPETDVYNTPHHYGIRCEYANGVTSTIADVNEPGIKWIGEDGWIHVTRGKLTASDARWTKLEFDPGPETIYASPGHMRNFLDGVKSRMPCIAPAETAHRSITTGHLGFVANALGKPLRWDAKSETIVGDAEAQAQLVAVDYRSPWRLPD